MKRFSLIPSLLLSMVYFVGCHQAVKLQVEYHRTPLVDNLSNSKLAICKFENKCEIFDAAMDVQEVILSVVTKEKIFGETVLIPSDKSPLYPDRDFDDFKTEFSNYDWNQWNESIQARFLILGKILYETQDFSAYESIWRVNKYGFRVPSQEWQDRMKYNIKMNIALIDLLNHAPILEETYDEDEIVEGAADEVSVFLDTAHQFMVKFFDKLVGEKRVGKRYLLRD